MAPPPGTSAWLVASAVAAALLAGCGFGGHGAADPSGDGGPTGAVIAADPGGGMAGRISASCRTRLARADASSRTRVAALRRLDRSRIVLDRALAPEHRALKRLQTHSDAAFRQAKAHPTAALIASSRATDRLTNAAVDRYNGRVDRYNADLRRLDALIRREDTAARTYDVDLRRCLMAIGDWRAATRRIELLLVDPARATGTRRPSVACDTPAARTPTRYDETGFVNEHSTVIHLSAPTCFGLERLLAHPTAFACAKVVRRSFENCPIASAAAVVSLVTLAHEEQHVDGVFDEAAAECYALQKTGIAAATAGLPEDVGRRIAAYTVAAIDQPREYHSRQCRKGGSLDLHVLGAPAAWVFR